MDPLLMNIAIAAIVIVALVLILQLIPIDEMFKRIIYIIVGAVIAIFAIKVVFGLF